MILERSEVVPAGTAIGELLEQDGVGEDFSCD
jgi:hypothetical protein